MREISLRKIRYLSLMVEYLPNSTARTFAHKGRDLVVFTVAIPTLKIMTGD